MLLKLFQTKNDVAPLVLRVLLGMLILPHCMQKLFGWFGGEGYSGTMGFFTGSMGFPAVLASLYMLAEPLACLGLVTGFLTRIAAFFIAVEMAMDVAMIHMSYGFFMNWNGDKGGEGIEYHLLVIVITVALMIRGGGKWSVDSVVSKIIESLSDAVQSAYTSGR
jgi:putative oxidoreductase